MTRYALCTTSQEWKLFATWRSTTYFSSPRFDFLVSDCAVPGQTGTGKTTAEVDCTSARAEWESPPNNPDGQNGKREYFQCSDQLDCQLIELRQYAKTRSRRG
jgi:hypothetical protein